MTIPPSAEQWLAVGDLVGELAELAPEERQFRLEAIGDPALRDTIRSLLDALDTGGQLFERPAAAWLGDAVDATDPRDWLGHRIGAWKLVAVIGRGGMGAVYAAERVDGDFTQQAAIKMLRPDLHPGIAIDRFRRERRLLARLVHRNIATLLDGGVTDDGRPWFAMELVEGEPITRWCARHRLTAEARLTLFRQACNAVQHAHRELVVHRDLKPGNILVTADGTVKLLDFGIAKLLESPDATEESITQWGVVPATPSYASPEQLAGAPVNTASDIYSLGVVLYELLTGMPPFPVESDPVGHRQRVAEETPRSLAESLTPATAAAMSDRSIGRLRRWLGGDVDRVVQMALRKDPARRYASADQFAADLLAVEERRPVLARPEGIGYRTRRFVARNPIAVVVIALLTIGLIATAGLAIDRAVRASRASREALAAAARAERVTAFLAEVLAAPDPWTGDRNVTVRELLDDASRRAGADFASEPRVEGAVRLALGRSYRGLGRWDDAERELLRAWRLTTQEHLDADRLEASRALAEVTAERGDADRARDWYDTAAVIAASLGDSLAIATVDADVAWLQGLQGDADSARAAALEALGIRRRNAAPPIDLANSLNNLAVAELQSGWPDSARGHVTEAVALLRDAGPDGEPPLASALATLGGMYSDLGDFPAAERNYREALELRRRIFGPGHPDEIGLLVNLAVNALDAKEPARALAITDTLIARIGPGSLPEDHPLAAAARTVRGRALNALVRHREALDELELALRIRRTALPPGHPALAFTLEALAEAQAATGHHREALASEREAVHTLEEAFGKDATRALQARQRLQAMEGGST